MPAIFRTRMGQITLLSGTVALAIPYVLFHIERYVHKKGRNSKEFLILLLLTCGFFICYLTIIRREPTFQEVIPPPFWSYRDFYRADIRWQIYMNAFMFIPFGFLLALALGHNFFQTLLITVLFSSFIELLQYMTRRGFCEFDDICNNTIGAAIGYMYWKFLKFYFKK